MQTRPAPVPSYIYAIVRRDIPHPHLSVQIGHALVAATNAYGNPNATHPNLVLCGVADEAELAAVFNRLKEQGVPVVGWYEEDMEGRLTALATGILTGAARKPFRKFKLLE